jgi:DNA-binding response OmpR family regulator
MGSEMQAIVVTSDTDERELLSFGLRHAGLAVAQGADLTRVLANWLEHPADLVVVAQEESAGLMEAIVAVRDLTDVPLIVIVDEASEGQQRALLRAGADLVFLRPLSLRVLAEYAHVLLRRTGAIPSFVMPKLDLEGISLDPSTRTVTIPEREPRRLTQLEYRLLYVLITNREQVIPTEAIVERVWGYSGEGDRDLVRGLVSRLRHKVEPDPDKPRFIQTIPGVGYQFTLESG